MTLNVIQKGWIVKSFCITIFILTLAFILFCVGYSARHPIDRNSNTQSQQGATQSQATITQQPNPNPRGEQAEDNQTYASKLFEPITILTALLVVGVAVTAYIYWRQLREMQKTVAAVERQGGMTQESLDETRKLVKQNERLTIAGEAQKDTMQGQLDAMKDSLAKTQKIVEQNERAVKAAEQSAKVAEQSFHSSERPHFGITNISMQFEVGQPFSASITFMNGGKTPAWHFYALTWVSLGWIGSENGQGIWNVGHQVGDLHTSFFPARDKKEINYGETDFVVTQERYDAVTNGKVRLFVKGTAHWKDSRGEHQWWDFCAVYYHSSRRFGDYLSTQ